jgi:hypothetical protein
LNTGIALGETAATAYRGDRGKTAYDHSQVTHNKTLVGLGNVDNTSDANKPISIATQAALDLKATTSTLTNASVGLGSVENKSSATIRSEIVDGDIPASIARAADVTALEDRVAVLEGTAPPPPVIAPGVVSLIVDPFITEAALTIELDAAGTFYYAIYGSGLSQQNNATIEGGINALDYGSVIVGTGNNAIKYLILNNLLELSSYRVHYFTENVALEQGTTAMSAAFSTLANAVYTPADDFRSAPDMPAAYAGIGLTTVFN